MLHLREAIIQEHTGESMQTVSHSQREKSRGLHHLVQSYLPAFSISMLGLVAIRIWIQCCLYDRYVSTDSGIITIVTNLFRVGVIVLFIALAVWKGFSPKAQNILGYCSIFAMMLAAVFFLVSTQVDTLWALWAACLCAGFGIVWGGGMWICAFVRVHPGEAFLYAFLSLGISSFFGFFLGLLSATVSYLIAIFMPPLALISYQKAQRILDEREQNPQIMSEGIQDNGPDTAYEKEPRSTFVRLLAGIALFNLALGIARGFPFGESIALPLAFQAAHQFVTVLLCAAVIWWALAQERSLKFSSLWNISVGCIALGVLLLATLDSALEPFGATLISLANTFSLGLLWFSIYDLSRHIKIPAYLVVSAVWSIHILPRELGRFAIWIAQPPHEVAAVVLTAIIVFFLAGSMAFLLNDSIPKTRPFFAEFRRDKQPRTFKDRVIAVTEVQTDTATPHATHLEDPALRSLTADGASDPFETALNAVQDAYFLTDREMEVVRLIAQGRSKAYVGKKLFISENTVKTYVKNIYSKLSIHSKEELLDCIEKAQPGASEE